MEKLTLNEITYLNRSKLIINESEDFISHTLAEEEEVFEEELKKRKLTLLSLGSLYVFLLLISFTLLN